MGGMLYSVFENIIIFFLKKYFLFNYMIKKINAQKIKDQSARKFV
jgi:hypothetical protein